MDNMSQYTIYAASLLVRKAHHLGAPITSVSKKDMFPSQVKVYKAAGWVECDEKLLHPTTTHQLMYWLEKEKSIGFEQNPKNGLLSIGIWIDGILFDRTHYYSRDDAETMAIECALTELCRRK